MFDRVREWFKRRRQVAPQRVGDERIPIPIRSRAGIRVDPDIGLTYSAVWACVRIISETLASMPWHVHRRKADGSRERVDDHNVDRLLNVRANPETTAFDWRQTTLAHVLTWGNGYSEIVRNKGVVVGLYQLPPDRVRPGRDPNTGALVYEVAGPQGQRDVLRQEDVLHIKGLGFDGLVGYSPIAMASQAIGLGLATERFGAEFFGNGAHHSSVLQHPGKLSDEAYANLKESFQEGGGIESGNWNRPLITEEGMEWKNISIAPDNAQFLETRKWQVQEIARTFRVPLFKLQEFEHAAVRANVEHSSIEFVTDTLMPWSVRLEQEVNAKLLPRSTAGDRRFFTRIQLNALLRGDVPSRYKAYAVGRQWGWLSANDVRRLEDMNPLPDDQGDIYLVPANMMPADQVAGQDGKDGADGEDGTDGEQGQQGETGGRGEQGDQGVPGAAGEPGSAGASGERGEVGSQGARGDAGGRGAQGEPGADGQAYGPALRRLLTDSIRRICRTEAGIVSDALRRHDKEAFRAWAGEFCKTHREHVKDKLCETATAIVEFAKGGALTKNEGRTVRSILGGYADLHCEKTLADLSNGRKVCEMLEEWRSTRIEDDVDTLMQRMAVPLLFGVVKDAAADAE